MSYLYWARYLLRDNVSLRRGERESISASVGQVSQQNDLVGDRTHIHVQKELIPHCRNETSQTAQILTLQLNIK